MDYVLRNRAPTSAYDAQILRDRRVQDRREDLCRHLREEETQRLNNSWYAKQGPISLHPSTGGSASSSAARLSPRPYGTLDDISGEPLDVPRTYDERRSPARLSSDYQPPPSRSPLMDVGLRDEVIRNPESHFSPAHSERAVPFSSSAEIARGTRSPLSAGHSPYSEDEYVSVQRGVGRCNFSTIRQRKSREFSGSQVAELLGGRSSVTPRSSSYIMNQSSSEPTVDYSQELKLQMQARAEEERRRKLAEEQFERERVRETLDEARRRIQMEDQTQLQKQQEAERLLRESARLAREAYEHARVRELEEEAIARRQREDMETRRQMEMHALKERMSRHASVATSGIDIIQQLVENIPKQSPLREAVQRLLEAHEDELEEIAPIVRDILNEPEFAASPWA